MYWFGWAVFKLIEFFVIPFQQPKEKFQFPSEIKLSEPIDTKSQKEITEDWKEVAKLSEIFKFLHETIQKNFKINDCITCGNNLFSLNDINSNSTGIHILCESCDEMEWIKNIHLNPNNGIKEQFENYINFEPLYFYNYADIIDRYNEIPKRYTKGHKKILDKIESTKDITEISYAEDDDTAVTNIQILLFSNSLN